MVLRQMATCWCYMTTNGMRCFIMKSQTMAIIWGRHASLHLNPSSQVKGVAAEYSLPWGRDLLRATIMEIKFEKLDLVNGLINLNYISVKQFEHLGQNWNVNHITIITRFITVKLLHRSETERHLMKKLGFVNVPSSDYVVNRNAMHQNINGYMQALHSKKRPPKQQSGVADLFNDIECFLILKRINSISRRFRFLFAFMKDKDM